MTLQKFFKKSHHLLWYEFHHRFAHIGIHSDHTLNCVSLLSQNKEALFTYSKYRVEIRGTLLVKKRNLMTDFNTQNNSTSYNLSFFWGENFLFLVVPNIEHLRNKFFQASNATDLLNLSGTSLLKVVGKTFKKWATNINTKIF